MTDIDAPHARRRIEQPVALAVDDVDAVTLVQQGALVRAEFDDIVPGMNKLVIALLEFYRRGHNGSPIVTARLLIKITQYIYKRLFCNTFQYYT